MMGQNNNLIFELMSSSRIVFALNAIIRCGVPDYLKKASSAKEIAKALNLNEDFLERLLRFLVVHGFFKQCDDGGYQHNEQSEAFKADHPHSLVPYINMYLSPWSIGSFLTLDQAVQEGESAFRLHMGEEFFDYLSKNEKESEIFNKAMMTNAELRSLLVCENYDFSAFKNVLDIGGGKGHIVKNILRKNSHLTGAVFDLPSVIQQAENDNELIDWHEGNFFEQIPTGYDLHIMGHIIHDWSDEDSLKILEQSRQSIAPHGKIILLERLLGQGDDKEVCQLDLIMMALTSKGKERTREEYHGLFSQSGFELTRAIPTQGPNYIIEARPV